MGIVNWGQLIELETIKSPTKSRKEKITCDCRYLRHIKRAICVWKKIVKGTQNDRILNAKLY